MLYICICDGIKNNSITKFAEAYVIDMGPLAKKSTGRRACKGSGWRVKIARVMRCVCAIVYLQHTASHRNTLQHTGMHDRSQDVCMLDPCWMYDFSAQA